MKDFAHHILREDATLLQGIEALNKLAAPNIFLVIVDENFRVVGTLTDGDVRRAILKMAPMSSAIRECIRAGATVGSTTHPQRNETLVRALRTRPRFLPIVDDNGILVEVLTADHEWQSAACALIMAGGRGTRLGDLTKTKPKPLMEVGGKPILGHVLDRLEQSGIRSVFVSVHYLSEQIAEYVASRGGATEIELVKEREPLGTGGALGLIAHRLDKPLVVLNGDIITNADISALLTFHGRNNNAATIAVKSHDVQIPYGVVRHEEGGRFLGIEEKPSVSHFVSAGLYILSPEVCALVQPERRIDMPDVINRAHDIGLKIGVFPIHEYWIDVGRPQDLEAAKAAKSDA